MPIAAPATIQRHLRDCPPGHHYGLYYAGWTNQWRQPNTDPRALQNDVGTLSKPVIALSDALRHRQHAQANRSDRQVLHYPALNDAPLTTGLGMEHPLENGFAFLNPYGVPYLPGSSIKGVLRSAAEALALGLFGDRQEWSPLAVWYLFGFDGMSAYLTGRTEGDRVPQVLQDEAARVRDQFLAWVNAFAKQSQPDLLFQAFLGQLPVDNQVRQAALDDPPAFLTHLATDDALRKEIHTQGCLAFWDVIPTVAGDQITVDILNPHHGEYYRGTQSPHDSGSPIPVFFLTLPPGSHFDFYIECTAPHTLPVPLANWQTLIQAALELALDWLGFGAKTSVGYGRMVRDTEVVTRQAAQTQRVEHWIRRHPVRETPFIPPPVPRDLSDEGRQVHELRQRFYQNSTGGKNLLDTDRNFFIDLGDLVKSALDGPWSVTDVNSLADLINTILTGTQLKQKQITRLNGQLQQLGQRQ